MAGACNARFSVGATVDEIDKHELIDAQSPRRERDD
jgi:hypothetical protein